MEESCYPHHMDYLPTKFKDKAKSQLFETSENLRIGAKSLKELIIKDKEMKEEWFTDEDILMYLRSRKFDIKKSFSSMKKMVAFIKNHKDFFEPVDQKLLNHMMDTGIFEVVSRRDREGRTIGVCRINKWDPAEITLTQFYRCATLIILNVVDEPMTQVNGLKCIINFHCSPFVKYIRCVTPYNVYFVCHLMLECIPMRIKAVHPVYATAILKLVLKMAMSIASEKLKGRIHVHNEPSEVITHIQPNVVPVEFGGSYKKEDESESRMPRKMTWPNYVTSVLEHFKSTQ